MSWFQRISSALTGESVGPSNRRKGIAITNFHEVGKATPAFLMIDGTVSCPEEPGTIWHEDLARDMGILWSENFRKVPPGAEMKGFISAIDGSFITPVQLGRESKALREQGVI